MPMPMTSEVVLNCSTVKKQLPEIPLQPETAGQAVGSDVNDQVYCYWYLFIL